MQTDLINTIYIYPLDVEFSQDGTSNEIWYVWFE